MKPRTKICGKTLTMDYIPAHSLFVLPMWDAISVRFPAEAHGSITLIRQKSHQHMLMNPVTTNAATFSQNKLNVPPGLRRHCSSLIISANAAIPAGACFGSSALHCANEPSCGDCCEVTCHA